MIKIFSPCFFHVFISTGTLESDLLLFHLYDYFRLLFYARNPYLRVNFLDQHSVLGATKNYSEEFNISGEALVGLYGDY